MQRKHRVETSAFRSTSPAFQARGGLLFGQAYKTDDKTAHIYTCVSLEQIVSKDRPGRLGPGFLAKPFESAGAMASIICPCDPVISAHKKNRNHLAEEGPSSTILQLSKKTLHLGILLGLKVNTIDDQGAGEF